MSKKFVGGGRGRGWLNSHKNENESSLGYHPQPTFTVGNPPKSIVRCVNEESIFVDAPEYEFLVNIIKQLNIEDDGIKFNQKMGHLLRKWNECCPTSYEVEKSFQAIYQACLHDEELASKLVNLMSSRTFISKVRDKNIRLLFLTQLQQNYHKSYKTNPTAFRNYVRMLGNFFNKGRLENGDPYSFLAVALVRNLHILLKSADPQDLRLLTTQLYMNGFRMRAECPEQFAKLLIDARITLVSEELAKESKLWLLLCIDGASDNFGLFSSDLHTFYHDEIGEAASAIIQRTPSILSIQTNQANKRLDSFQSDVNVLRVCDSSTEKFSKFSKINVSDTSQGYSSDYVSDSSNDGSNSRKSRKPCMPILVGSRVNVDTKTRREGRSGSDGKPIAGLEVQSNDSIPQVSSTNNSSASDISNNSSGFVSDSSTANFRSPPRRMYRRPILSVRAVLRKYNVHVDVSSTCDEVI